MDKRSSVLRAIIVMLMVLHAGSVLGQRTPLGVPLDLHRGEARFDPTGITFCIDTREPEWRMHEEIAEHIAAELILEPKFFHFGPELSERTLDVSGIPDNLLFVLLDDECDVYMGIRVNERSIHPEFLITTRSYLSVDLVIASFDEAVLDIDAFDGGQDSVKLGLAGDGAANVAISLFKPQTNRRIFRGEKDLLRGVFEHQVAAGVFWEPSLYALVEEYEERITQPLFVRSLSNVPATEWELSGGLNSRNEFLRTSIDEAIKSLDASGTLQEIKTRHYSSGLVIRNSE